MPLNYPPLLEKSYLNQIKDYKSVVELNLPLKLLLYGTFMLYRVYKPDTFRQIWAIANKNSNIGYINRIMQILVIQSMFVSLIDTITIIS